MTDEELIARLRGPMPHMPSIKGAPSILVAVARERKDAADRIEALVKELTVSNELGRAFEEDAGQQRERAKRLEAALRKLHHAVCGETGFAACVRLDSGKAYPWPALDDADENARAALKGADHE